MITGSCRYERHDGVLYCTVHGKELMTWAEVVRRRSEKKNAKFICGVCGHQPHLLGACSVCDHVDARTTDQHFSGPK